MREPPATLWGVYTVWHRNFGVYVKTWMFNCIPPLTEPLIYLVSFGLGLRPVIRELVYYGAPVEYLTFLAPGMIALAIVTQSYFEAAYGAFFRISYQRTWHAMLTAPVSYTDVYLGDLLWASTKGILGGVLTGLISAAFGLIPVLVLLKVLPLIVLASVLFSAVGAFTAGYIRSIEQINLPTFLFIIPMTVMSGTYFPRDGFPWGLRVASDILPLAAVSDLLRFHIALPPYWPLSVLWLLAWTALWLRLSWKVIRKKIIL